MIRLTMTKRQLAYWLTGLTTVPVLLFSLGVVVGVGIQTRVVSTPMLALAPPVVDSASQQPERSALAAPESVPETVAVVADAAPLAQTESSQPPVIPVWDLQPAAGGKPLPALAVAPALAIDELATDEALSAKIPPTETTVLDTPEAVTAAPLLSQAAPAASPDSTAPDAGAAASAAPGRLYEVQVGSFTTETKARGFASRLNEKGYQAFTLRLADAATGRVQYKVRFGQYPQRVEADAAAKRYREQEKSPAFIIVPTPLTTAAKKDD